LETQKTENSQGNTEEKMLEVSQYPTLNCTAVIAIKTACYLGKNSTMKTSGTD
jgi:hypothetical protein